MNFKKLILPAMALFAMTVCAQTHTQGIEYYKADQFYNAEELLKRNLNNPGTDKALSYYYLGQIELRNKNKAAAAKYFQDGINANEGNPYNYVGMGAIQLYDGDVKGAEKYFKDAESRAKKDQTLQMEIARAYYNADPVTYKDKYEKKIADALKKDAKNPDIYILEGDILRKKAYATKDSKVYGQAATKYNMAINNDPQSAVAYVKYANMYMEANNPQYAIDQLEELVRANPTSALGQRELANAYYENNQYSKAAEQYGQYVKNPNHFKEDEDRYSFILFADNKYGDGYDYATQLLTENPSNFTARRFQFMNAAQMDSMKDQLLPMADKLWSEHKLDLKKNKFAAIDYTLIADEFGKAGRIDDAIAVLSEGIEQLPANTNFYKQMASIYVDANDLAKAADAMQDYINNISNPGYNEFAQEALYAYFAGAQTSDEKYLTMAEDYANKAIAANGTMYKPYKILGDVKMLRAQKDDQPKVAQQDYLQAVQLLEANPDPRYNSDAKVMYNYLGNFYLDRKDVDQAKKYFNKYLVLDPDNAEYRKFVESLK